MFMWTHPQSLDHNPQTSSNTGEEEEEEEEEREEEEEAEKEEEREKGGKGATVYWYVYILRWMHFLDLSPSSTPSLSLGLDPKLLASILNTASGRCWSCDTYNPCPGVMEGVPSSNDYQGGFGTGLMAKVYMMSQITLYHFNRISPDLLAEEIQEGCCRVVV